jgi:GntR family transcriptional regulator
MIVQVDTDSAVPVFEQLRQQLSLLITTGSMPEGDRLPPIRRLAGDLDLAPGTVARAYRELEQAGLVATAGRRGTRVAPRDHWAVPATDTASELETAASKYATTALQLNVTADEALAAVSCAIAGNEQAAANDTTR